MLRTTPGYGPLALNSFDVGAYRKAFGEACLIDVGQSIQSTFDIHSMLILMKHQKKLHLCPFGQTHRPKRQRKQRFQLPTELAAVLQPHSKVSRVGGRNGLCGSTGLVSFLGHLHVTICYIYLRTSCSTSCLLTMEAANEESDKSPGTDLHKLLACGLMDTDAQAGVTNPGKRFAMSKTNGTIVLKYSFGDRDGFVRACQSYVSAVKARVAVFDHPAQRGCGM